MLVVSTLISLLLLPALRGISGLFRSLPLVPAREAAGAAPFVSIVVPARNEERVIEGCITSLLEQRYPRFEVIVVDDRSTDATPRILERLAAVNPRLHVRTGIPLPAGWVGKCWALHQGASEARGDWLLFVDADTTHQPWMLASAAAYAGQQQLDLLSLGPHQELGSFWERAVLPGIFGVIMTVGGSLAEVNDPDKPLAKANGQFMLFRGSAYRRIGGHESVRNEIVDDFALARRVKGTRHRLALADGRNLLSVRMYHSLQEIWEGFSKNTYFEAQRQQAGVLASIFLPWIAVLTPPLLIGVLAARAASGSRLHPADRLVLAQSGLQCAILAAFSVRVVRLLDLPLRWALAVPPSLLFLSGVLMNSAVRLLSGRGVTWRGRRYDRMSTT